MNDLDIKKLDTDLDVTGALGHVVLWFIIMVVTLGFGAFLFPYAFTKTVINKTYLVDAQDRRVGRLKCDLDLGSQIGHAIIWFILSVITLGFAYLIYFYKVFQHAIKRTSVESV